MKEFKNILVIQTAFPGDIVLTTPLFRAVKRLFQASRLTVLTTPPGYELLRDMAEIDAIRVYDKKCGEAGISKFFGIIKDLKGEGFDLCISPHRSFRTSLMVLATGATERVGFSDASLSTVYNVRIVRDKTSHEVDRLLSLFNPFIKEGDTVERQPHLEVSPDASQEADGLLNRAGIPPGERFIAVAPGSVWGTKRWIPDGYAVLIDELIERYKVKVLLIGSTSEMETAERIAAMTKKVPVNLTGKTSLRELVAVISRSVLLVGNDSAPGHIASARGVPVVSIFGPTVPAFGYYPYGKDVIVVEKTGMSCRPCHHHGPMNCPEGHFRCMKEITADDVMGAINKLMETSSCASTGSARTPLTLSMSKGERI